MLFQKRGFHNVKHCPIILTYQNIINLIVSTQATEENTSL